jgi:hypothetical protein
MDAIVCLHPGLQKVRERLKSQKGLDYIAKMPSLLGKALISLTHETVCFGTDCTATPIPVISTASFRASI